MEKFLQKVFKSITYFLFSKIYGKIEKYIDSSNDSRIKIDIVNIEQKLKYKIYKINEGRLYTDRIHDTAVMLNNSIVKGPSFQLRYEDSKIYNSKVTDNIVFTKGTPRILKKLDGKTLSLLTGGAGNSNYWHWLFDVLPRIALCNKIIDLKRIDYFLLPNLFEKFQKETLDSLDIPKNKRLSSKKFRHIKTEELIVTDHPVVVTGDTSKDIQNIPSWIIFWLKKSFVKNTIKNKENKNKIYIDRKDSRHASERLISNEDEVKKYLLKNDFISVNLSEIKFLDQVDLFFNAECVVGLHGAGFANTVFCEPGTKVVELRGLNAGPVIENLAKTNNLNYHSIIVEAKQIQKFSYPNQQGSIQIPIETLGKILEN